MSADLRGLRDSFAQQEREYNTAMALRALKHANETRIVGHQVITEPEYVGNIKPRAGNVIVINYAVMPLQNAAGANRPR